MTVYAREAIKKGDILYHSYAKLLLPTNLRRLMLYTGKHFSCECRYLSASRLLHMYGQACGNLISLIA